MQPFHGASTRLGRELPSHEQRNINGSSLEINSVYLGIVGSSTVFLLQMAETNSLLDISNILGDTPAINQAPESLFIDESQFLYLTLSS